MYRWDQQSCILAKRQKDESYVIKQRPTLKHYKISKAHGPVLYRSLTGLKNTFKTWILTEKHPHS